MKLIVVCSGCGKDASCEKDGNCIDLYCNTKGCTKHGYIGSILLELDDEDVDFL